MLQKYRSVRRLAGKPRARCSALVGFFFTIVVLVGYWAGAPASAFALSPSGSHQARHARGGSLTVGLISVEWPSLDPLTDTDSGYATDLMNAIYGELFEQGPRGKILPSLATGYSWTDHNTTLRIFLRKGVLFQDGTPFNAQAVAANLDRELTAAKCGVCALLAQVPSVATPGPYEVDLHVKTPYVSLLQTFLQSAFNWTASPTALKSEGTVAFGQHPVGAGPFQVVSMVPSSTVKLKRYAGYWQRGHPYLATLKFVNVPSPASAYDALETNQVQVINSPLDASTFSTARRAGRIDAVPGNSVYCVCLNMRIAPFNNLQAREAVYYAIDSKLLLKKVGLGFGSTSESPSGPGSIFYEPTVPGYRGYDLAKARKIVKSLGGLSFTLSSYDPGTTVLAQALYNQMSAAGMKVHLVFITLPQRVEEEEHNTWQASVANGGGVDPAEGAYGFIRHFASYSASSGVHDPQLDRLIGQAAGAVAASERKAAYLSVFNYIGKMAYSPFLYVVPSYIVKDSNVTMPGVESGTGQTQVNWESVSVGASLTP